MNLRASIGSAARNRPTCALTIQRWRDGRPARLVESADSVCDRRRTPAPVPQAPDRQSDELGHARRQGRLDARGASRQRRMSISTISCCSTCRSRSSDTSLSRDREKYAPAGVPYQTGGGRTVNANVIDIMITWMVNQRPRIPARRSDQCDQARHQHISLSGFAEHGIADRGRQCRPVGTAGSGLGSHRPVRRHVASVDCQDRVNRRRVSANCARSKRSTASRSSNVSNAIDNSQRFYRYTMISGIPAVDYTGTLDVKAEGDRQLGRVAGAVSGGWPTRPLS